MAEAVPAARPGARLWRITLALFMAGFATFSLIYSVQPLLAEFAREFRLDPAASSLSRVSNAPPNRSAIRAAPVNSTATSTASPTTVTVTSTGPESFTTTDTTRTITTTGTTTVTTTVTLTTTTTLPSP